MSDIVSGSTTNGPLAAKPIPAAPPHPLDDEWHLHSAGQTYGPYTGHQLKEFVQQGRIDGSSQVMLVGSAIWTRIGEEAKLSSILRASAPVPPHVTAAAGATVVQVTNNVGTPYLFVDDGSPFGQKSAGLALLLSLLFCGAGQMYCGRVAKGILMFLGCVLLWLVMLGWIIQIWSMVDAYNTAKKMNMRYLQRLQATR